MKKLIFTIIVVCVLSCRNSYSEWANVIYEFENGASLHDLSNKFGDVTFHIAVVVFLNVDNLKLTQYDSNPLKKYVKIKQCIEQEEYQKALNQINDYPDIKALTTENEFFIQFNLNLLKARALDNLDLRSEMKYTLDQLHRMSKKCDYKSYCIAQISLLESDFYKSVNKYLESLSSLHYGLHMLEADKRVYPKLRQELLCKKAAILIERFNNDELVAERILDDVINNPTGSQKYIEALSNLIFVNRRLENYSKSDSLIQIGLENFDSFDDDQKNYLSINIMDYYLQRMMPEKAINHVNYYPTNYTNECEKNKFVSEMYLISALLEKNETDSAKVLLEKLAVSKKCPLRTKKLIDFYKEYINISLASKEGDLKSELELLLRHRRLAQELYDSKFDLHLDNYYAGNLESIFKNLMAQFNNLVPEDNWNKVLNLYSNSRNRQMNLASQKGLLFGIGNNQKIDSLTAIIQYGLSESNDFTNLNDYGKSYYKDLYETVLEFNESTASQHKKMKIKNSGKINLERLRNELENNDNSLLCILEGVREYWMLHFDGDKMLIFNTSKIKVDELHEKTIFGVINKLKPKPILNDSIFNTYIDESSELVIIPDGKFTYLPFDLSGNKYTTTYSINSLFDNSGELSASKSMLLSFSDPTTRKSRFAQEIGELYHDYEECNELHQILGRNGAFYHGADCNFENLSKSSGLDLLHISSHGGSNLENRFKSYVYLRENELPSTVHLNELYNLENTPTFVCLSLCDSGVGKNMLGAGTFSLSRPFFKNGTKTILKTLWKTDDEGSKLFMSKFYSNWISGLEVSDALFKTKNEMRQIKKYEMPYFWAGYVLEGNGNFYLKG